MGNSAQELSDYPFSYAAWVRSTVPADYTATRATIMGLVRTAPNTTYTTLSMGFPDVANPGDLELVRRNTSFVANDAVGTRSILTDGAWHHVAAVMPAHDSLQLYVNGVLWSNISPETVATVGFQTAINALEIGVLFRNTSGGGTASDFWIGDIDDVRLYSQALTAEEVAALAVTATPVPGDFDGDGDVDGADFVVWQTNFPTATGATLATGDADGDGDVDGADFVVWQTSFPTTTGPGATPIPEPASIVLAVIAIGMACCCRHRQRA